MSEIKDMPWLIFKIKETFYALNCAHIQSIIPMPEEIDRTQLPNVPHYIRGVTKVREDVIPILGLRELYHIPSAAEEYENFKAMIDQRKREHAHWVDELEYYIKDEKVFSLATDPHLCAFGKWFYHHESFNSSVNFVLNKIEEPHRKFHEVGLKVLHCSQEYDRCTRDKCVKTLFDEAKYNLMPQILKLLDEVKTVFAHSYGEKIVILKINGKSFGVIVDDVQAIDEIQVTEGQEEFMETMQNPYIVSVGRGKKSDDLVLMMHAEYLLNVFHDSTQAFEH